MGNLVEINLPTRGFNSSYNWFVAHLVDTLQDVFLTEMLWNLDLYIELFRWLGKSFNLVFPDMI